MYKHANFNSTTFLLMLFLLAMPLLSVSLHAANNGEADMVNGAGIKQAKLTWNYDCETGIFSFTVDAAIYGSLVYVNNYQIENEIYVMKNGPGGGKLWDASTGTIEWINRNFITEKADGYRGSFSLSTGSHSLLFHCNVFDSAEEQQTAGTTITFELVCYPIGINLLSFEANAKQEGVLLEWYVESEFNHAGYNVYRSTSEAGPFTKINSALILSASENRNDKNYEFLDTDIQNGDSFYKLEDVSLTGHSTFHGPIPVSAVTGVEDRPARPMDYSLSQNYPNPFNPTTTINYTLPSPQDVELAVYNIQGERVRLLVNSPQAAGQHTVTWDATNEIGQAVSSGLYMYKISAGEFSKTARMILLK